MDLLQIGSHCVERLQGLSGLRPPPLQQWKNYNYNEQLPQCPCIIVTITAFSTAQHMQNFRHRHLRVSVPYSCTETQKHRESSKGNVIKCMLTDLLNECECQRAAVWLSLVSHAEKMRPPRSYQPNRQRRQMPSTAELVFTVSACRCANAAPDRLVNQAALSVN